MEINKFNAAGHSHGYWKSEYEGHFYKAHRVGYFENLITGYCCHYSINGREIGCESWDNGQYYFNRSNKKFGEQIRWK